MHWKNILVCSWLLLVIAGSWAADVDNDLENLGEFFRKRGMEKMTANDLAGAVSDFEKAWDAGEQSPELLKIRALAKFRIGQYSNGMLDLKLLIKLRPEAKYYQLRGTMRQLAGDLPRAIEDFDLALELDNTNAKIWSNRGIAKMNLEQFDEALVSLNKALKLQPGYAIAQLNRGIVKHHMQDYTGAIIDYDLALLLKPKWAEANALRQDALEQIERQKLVAQ